MNRTRIGRAIRCGFRATAIGAALIVIGPTCRVTSAADDAPSAIGYRRLIAEYESREKEAVRAYRAAKTEPERKAAFSRRPKSEPYTRQIMALVLKDPRADFAFEALLWVARYGDSRPEASDAIELLFREYGSRAELTAVLPELVESKLPGAERWLRTTINKNPHREVQAHAMFFLARRLKRQSESPSPEPAEAARLNREAEALLERLLRDYRDVQVPGKALAQLAESQLYEIRHLSIGMRVPEIEGEDVHGRRFKLSDYRGKVVMLDFWGHW